MQRPHSETDQIPSGIEAVNEHIKPEVHVPLDAGLFDPDNPEDSWTLPADWYYRPDVYELEHEAIFFKNWWYVCHVSDVCNPGDYFCGEIAGQGVFVIRDSDGELRAFYNVCSHRGHPLLEGKGNTNLIVCPYHQWCYQSDGCFRGARGRETLKSWVPDNANLKPVRLESYGGLLFVNLDLNATPLIEQAPKFLKDMYACCPRFDDLIRVTRREFEVAANWKTLVDNNHECYHCQVNHPSLMELVEYDTKATWSDDGITFTHTVERNELDSTPYTVDSDTITQNSLFGYVWPSHIPLFYPGTPSMVLFQILPLAPERSLVRHDWFLLNEESSEQEAALMDWFSGTLAQEDIGICEKVQKSLHSKGYRQGKFVVDRAHPEFSEHHVHFFQKLVYQALMK